MKYTLSGLGLFLFHLIFSLYYSFTTDNIFYPDGFSPFSSAQTPHWSLAVILIIINFFYIALGYLSIRNERRYVSGIILILLGIITYFYATGPALVTSGLIR